MAGKVIMPNSHVTLEDHSQCLGAAGETTCPVGDPTRPSGKDSWEGGRGRDSPTVRRPQGSRLPHPQRELTVSLYVRTLLKVMCSVCVCAPGCCCAVSPPRTPMAQGRGRKWHMGCRSLWRHRSWWSSVRQCRNAYGVVVYAVMLCSLPVATEGFCPSGCDCDYSSMTVSCDGAGLEGVPILLNPRVKDLLLHNNRIRSLSQSLVFYLDLRLLDLSGNALVSLGEDNFKEQRKLRELRLSHNQLQKVGGDGLRGLEGVRRLTLDHNVITYLEDSAFVGLDNLAELALSHNMLRSVGAAALRGLSSLESLDLSGNKLSRAPGGGLTNLTSLLHLNLTHNLISQVPPRAFSGFPALSSLALDMNNISIIDELAFSAARELLHLTLSDNRLLTVPSASLAALPRLEYLDLSGNLFVSLPEDCFKGLTGLKTLRVSRCPRLHTVSGEAFLSTGSLDTVQLSQNPRMASLPSAALASLLTLRHLDLTACGLRTLMPTQVPLQHLASLRLAGNPLHCNCSLVWFSRLAANPNTTLILDQPVCASPPALYGLSLRGLDEDAVGCDVGLGVWAVVACVGVGALGLLILAVFLICIWIRRRKRWRRRRRSSEDKIGGWEDPFHPDGHLSVTRLPLNGDPAHYTLSPPTRLGPPPRLPPMHPLNQHLHHHHQNCLQHCPYAALHPLYHPLLHPDHASYSDGGARVSPTTSSPSPAPPLSEPPNWYATIGGGDGGEDSGRESRPPTPLDPSPTPRKVPVTYV